jgi:hypothetical protein
MEAFHTRADQLLWKPFGKADLERALRMPSRATRSASGAKTRISADPPHFAAAHRGKFGNSIRSSSHAKMPAKIATSTISASVLLVISEAMNVAIPAVKPEITARDRGESLMMGERLRRGASPSWFLGLRQSPCHAGI